MRRVALVSFDWHRPKDPPLSLGHASIQTHLRQHNIQVKSLCSSVISPTFSIQNLCDKILTYNDSNTDLAIGAYIWNEHHVQYLTKWMKQSGWKGNIILGTHYLLIP